MTKLTKAQMQSIITAVINVMQAAPAAKKAAKSEGKPLPLAQSQSGVDAKTDRSLKAAAATIRAFKKAGYGDVTPRVDVMTYNRWLAAGRKVIPGQKSIKVGTLRLFHISQTEPVEAQTKAEKVQEVAAAQQNADAVHAVAVAEGLVSAKPDFIKADGSPGFVTKVPMGVSGAANVVLPEPPLG